MVGRLFFSAVTRDFKVRMVSLVKSATGSVNQKSGCLDSRLKIRQGKVGEIRATMSGSLFSSFHFLRKFESKVVINRRFHTMNYCCKFYLCHLIAYD